DGMGALVEALARGLPEGVVRLQAPAGALAHDGATWRLRASGEALIADALVLAAPAHAVAPLLAPLDAALGRLLGEIEYASSATVTLAYRRADVPGGRGSRRSRSQARPTAASACPTVCAAGRQRQIKCSTDLALSGHDRHPRPGRRRNDPAAGSSAAGSGPRRPSSRRSSPARSTMPPT